MAVKNIQNRTSKYSSLAKNVKGHTPEEPKITPEQVVKAFHSFNFEPNQRGANDIGYWTTRPQSEGVKLMEELHKRRADIIKKDDEDRKHKEDKEKNDQDFKDKQEQTRKEVEHKQNTDKIAMPRLSDNDITALYDEYGLPVPDPEWVRNHMPNDPKRMRSILEMQRKHADDLIKKHTKNSVNSIPEVPKAVAGGVGGPYRGMGGPTGNPVSSGNSTPMGMQGGMVDGTPPTNPFFVGDHSLVRIANPNNPNTSTTWLVDAKRKVLRPFLSDQAFQNAFEDPAEAEKAVVNISTKELGPGGALDGFKPLQANQGVNHDGSMGKIDFSPAEIQNRYGKPEDSASENKSLSILDSLLGRLNKAKQ